MRGQPTIQPTSSTEKPHAYLHCCLFASLHPLFFPVFTVQHVISRTSAPAAPRLPPTFAAVSHQNAPAAYRQATLATRPRITLP